MFKNEHELNPLVHANKQNYSVKAVVTQAHHSIGVQVGRWLAAGGNIDGSEMFHSKGQNQQATSKDKYSPHYAQSTQQQ